MEQRVIFPSNELVVGFPVVKSDVLLSIRRRDPWLGNFSGLSGSVEKADQNIFEAMIREAKEEAGIEIDFSNMEKRGEIQIFREEKKPITLNIIFIHHFRGIPKTTKTMGPHLLFPIENLPTSEMIPGDKYWVYRMLKGEFITGKIFRSADAEKLLEIEIA